MILTGGGDCPGLNAVIRAVYKTLKTNCDCRIMGILDGFDGLIEDRFAALECGSIVLKPIGANAGKKRCIEPDNQIIKDAMGISISFGI